MVLLVGWNELLITSLSHRSLHMTDGIMLSNEVMIHRNSAHVVGVGTIFDRVLSEIVQKMRDLKIDRTELACMKAIILFNPGKYGRYSCSL